MSQPYPVSLTYQLQQQDMLLEAIADWSDSTGTQRGINRRYAMRLLAAERARRDWRHEQLRAVPKPSDADIHHALGIAIAEHRKAQQEMAEALQAVRDKLNRRHRRAA